MTRILAVAVAAILAGAPVLAAAPSTPAPSAAPEKAPKADGAAAKTPFGDLGADSNQPIHVSADNQSFDFNASSTTYTGNVRAEQGKMTLRANTVVAEAPKNHLSRITATGDVVITSEDATARAPTAVYDVSAHTLVLSGDVTLTQGPNTLRGTLLTVDLTTSTAKLTAGTGRVDGVLMPNSVQKAPGAKTSKPPKSATHK